MDPMIPLSVPNLDLDILDNIKETIESGWVSTGGRFIGELERQIIDFTGAKGARGVQSGTAGLHVALRVLGTEINDEIIVPTLTFIASINPVRYLGANPVFMDCDDQLNMDSEKLRDFLSEECEMVGNKTFNKKTKRPVKGIIVVHIFGNPVNIEPIMDLASEYNLFVLEDACEALGSFYTEGRYAGKHCGTIGDIGVYSFNANKIITTGNGGMVVSDNQKILTEVNFLGVQAKSDPLRYKHDDIGYNYRLTNISAAFGVSQMEKINSFLDTKKKNYFHYKQGIESINGLRLLPFSDGTSPNYWFYSLFIEPEIYGLDRETLMQVLLGEGIETRPIWGLIHEQKPYQEYQAYRIEKASYYVDHILNLPCSTNLSSEDVETVLQILRKKAITK
jgi:perosamine synthetase